MLADPFNNAGSRAVRKRDDRSVNSGKAIRVELVKPDLDPVMGVQRIQPLPHVGTCLGWTQLK
jgi:hypothetical protein